MLWALLAKGGMQQGQQAAPGVKADPFGSFSHFMGSATANAFDPFNFAGHSGNNPVKNFLNPGGATLINGMTPSNNPLPINPNGTPNPSLGYSPMGTGISQPQMGSMSTAYANYLRNLGQGGMAHSFLQQMGPPPPMSGIPGTPPGGGLGGAGGGGGGMGDGVGGMNGGMRGGGMSGGFSPQALQQLLQLQHRPF